MIISDAPNCGVTYDRHCDDRNSFIIQATGPLFGGNTRGLSIDFGSVNEPQWDRMEHC